MRAMMSMRVLREAKLSVRVPLERPVVCIWVTRWVGISGPRE